MKRLSPYKRRRDVVKVPKTDHLADRGYLQHISEVFLGFQWLATRLIRLTSLCTRGKTERLQSYSEWASTFLDLLYDERQPDILQRKKCIGTFELISTYSMRSRARCLLSAYMIAQGRLLVDAYEESRLVYTEALATLGKELQKAKSSVSEMRSAVEVLRDAPGWTGQRAKNWVNRTNEALALLDRIEATYRKKSQSGKIWRPIERLLIAVALGKGKTQPKTRLAIVRWMRAAQAASGKHPPGLDALYKVATRSRDKWEVSNLTSGNH